jgi:tetratricopeptide (TPR) repeat protein
LERKHVPEAIDYLHRAANCLENGSSPNVNSLTLMAQVAALLGDAFLILREWDTAIRHYRDAELNWAGLNSMNDEDLMCHAEVLIGLGTAFLIGKRHPQSALEPLINAVELLKKIRKPDLRATGSLAGTLDRLGSAQADAGRHEEALASYLEAQTIFRRLPGDKAHNVANLAINLLNVARLKREKGDEEEAKKNLTEAETICQMFLNPSEPPNEEIALFLANLGRAYKDFKLDARGAVCFHAAMNQLQRLAASNQQFAPCWAQVFNEYVDLLAKDNRVHDLITINQESILFLRKLNESSDGVEGDLAVNLGNLAYWLLKADRIDEAISAYEEANNLLSPISLVSPKWAASHAQIQQGLVEAHARRGTTMDTPSTAEQETLSPRRANKSGTHVAGTRQVEDNLSTKEIEFASYWDRPTRLRMENFIAQFPKDMRWLGERLIYAIDYYDRRSLWELSTSALLPLSPNCRTDLCLCLLGGGRESSSLMSHLMHKGVNIPYRELNDALMDEKHTSILFHEDCSITGKQVVKTLSYYLAVGQMPPRKVDRVHAELIPKLRSRHVIFVASVGTELSELYIGKFLKEHNISHEIRFGKKIPLLSPAGVDDLNAGLLWDGKGITIQDPGRQLADPLFSPTSRLECGSEWRRAKTFCEKVGSALLEEKRKEKSWSKEWHKASSLGYGGMQGRLVLYHNVPKPTLTLLWCAGTYENSPWVPLFPPPPK